MNSTTQPDPTTRDNSHRPGESGTTPAGAGPGRTTPAGASPGGRGLAHHDPADLAPGVERSWADAFVVEQRLLGVPGVRIGDALATVESHVAESGESAEDVFGDARAYARELAGKEQPLDPSVLARLAASSVLGVIGLLVTVNAFAALLEGEKVQVTVGLIATAVLLLLTLGAFLAKATAVLRVVVERVWLACLALAVLVGSSVALMLLLPAAVLEVPAGLLLAAGVVMLLADVVLGWTGPGGDDPVLAPGEDAPTRRWGRLLTVLVMPAGAVLLLALTWVVHALG